MTLRCNGSCKCDIRTECCRVLITSLPGRRIADWAVLFPIKLLLPLTARSIFQRNIIALQYLRSTVCSVIYVQGQPVEGSCTRLWIPAMQLVLGSVGLKNLQCLLRRNETLLVFFRCYRRLARRPLQLAPPGVVPSFLFLVFVSLSLTAKAPRKVVIHYSTNSMRTYEARICSLIIFGIFTPYFSPIWETSASIASPSTIR